MKVYVSEMPKGCLTCPYIVDKGDYDLCSIKDYVIDDAFKYVDKRKKSCPLLSLSDHTKQVRKEVCDGLALPLIKHFQKDAEFTVEEICKWIEEYKNQIQGETK